MRLHAEGQYPILPVEFCSTGLLPLRRRPMQHDTPLITMIVAGLVLAYIFGMIANRFKMPPLVGYLFAGILAGPYTPGFVADQALSAELAELGVILLMFGV